MKRKMKKFMIAAAVAMAMFGNVMTVSAADKSDVFDADYYAQTYPDVAAAYGNDTEGMYQHYVTYGVAEGRTGSPNFDVRQYRAAYADLEAAYGDNWGGYLEHYIAFGQSEGRTAGVSNAPSAPASTTTPTPAPALTPDTTPVPASAGTDWFSQKGYALAPATFQMKTGQNGSGDRMDVLLNITDWSIYETNDLNGNKTVELMVCFENPAGVPDWYGSDIAFDKYTGRPLESEWTSGHIEDVCLHGIILIDVKCPLDYDGVMFCLQPWNESLEAAWQNRTFSDDCTVDDLTLWTNCERYFFAP